MAMGCPHSVDYLPGKVAVQKNCYRSGMERQATTGELLRDWRQRRRMTQLDLADSAGVSTRHVSFIETGRSLPSRSMLLKLGALLDVPLRERNTLMVSAGYAPMYREHRLDEAEMSAAREAIERLLSAHEPYPALAVDRHWHLVTANRAAQALLVGLPEALLQPSLNVLRVSLHPQGLASRIDNLAEWRAHVLERLRHQHATTSDPQLAELLAELQAYPGGEEPMSANSRTASGIVVPLRLRLDDTQVLSFLSTTTVFGTPRDITLAELAIESFFPADAQTAARLQAMSGRAAYS